MNSKPSDEEFLSYMEGGTNPKYYMPEKKSVITDGGAGIISGSETIDDIEDDGNIEDILKNINQGRIEDVQKREEELLRIQREKQELDNKQREEEKAALLQRMAEIERKEKEEYLRQKEEEERLAAEEEERRRKFSIFYKVGTIVKKGIGNVTSNMARNNDDEEEGESRKEKKRRKKEERREIAAMKKEEESLVVEENDIDNSNEDIEETKEKKNKKKKSEKKSKENEKTDYEYLALHDKLTGLYNQTAWEMRKEKPGNKGDTIVFFDLNGLKLINDNLGHEMGNKLITTVSDMIESNFNEGECYRIGGDEFVAYLKGVGENELKRKMATLRMGMEDATNKDSDKLIYSCSMGYCILDGNMSVDDASKKADAEMYKAKELFKKKHPELDARNPKSASTFAKKGETSTNKKNDELTDDEYNDLLDANSRELKTFVSNTHRAADGETTERILAEIQKRASDIYGILVADKTFNNLFIFSDPDTFLDAVMEGDGADMFDYSYLYVIYEGGPQYYGADDYLQEITHLFEEITKVIRKERTLTNKSLLKIKGINIFKNICFC